MAVKEDRIELMKKTMNVILEIGIGYSFTTKKDTGYTKQEWCELSDDEKQDIINENVWEVISVTEVV